MTNVTGSPGAAPAWLAVERMLTRLLHGIGTVQFLLAVGLILVLGYLILAPLFEMIARTVMWGDQDRRLSRAAVAGEYTDFHWREAFFGPTTSSLIYEPLVNTLITGCIAAVFALLVGALCAWLVTRTDVPGKGPLRTILTLPYIVPSFALALAWDALFKSPKVGGQPGLMQAVFGWVPAEGVSNGAFPIIATMAIHYFPFAFLLVCGALATVNSEIEESAEIAGASRMAIVRRITFPLIAPALLAAFILTFGKTIGTFALPYLLGAPAQYHTLATMLYAVFGMGLDALGYILSLILIALTAITIFVSNRVLGKNLRRFETIGGKGFRTRTTPLGPWRWPIGVAAWAFAFAAAAFPLLILAYQTLMLVNGRYGLDNLTLHFWIGESNPNIAWGEPGLIHNDVILGATWNTLKLAFLSALMCGFLGLIIGYLVVRERGRWFASTLDQISFVPFLFPALAFSAMYLSMFAVPHGPIPALYGTFTLLVLISVINRLPYGVRISASAVMQVGTELEEAAAVCGASWWRRLRRIVAPLAASGVVAGIMISFVGVMRELSLILLLITPDTRVLMTVGFRYAEEGQVQFSNALILLVTALTVLGELLIWRVEKSRLARAGRGGSQ